MLEPIWKMSRPELRSGHIPQSRNLHYATLLAADGTLREPQALRAIFAQAGVDLGQPIAATCGSGVTACTLALALHELGIGDVAVYDGSWSEWGARKDTPIET